MPSQRPPSRSAASAFSSPARARPASTATGSPDPAVVAAPLASSPAISSSASRPASVSRQPRLPHAHGRPPGSSVMWPNSPPKPCEPRNSSPRTMMPAPTPISPDTYSTSLSPTRRALPQLGHRGEVRLVVGGQRERRPGQPLAQLVDDRDVVPAEVRRHQQRAGGGVHEPGQRHRRADRAQPVGVHGLERRGRVRREPVEHLRHRHAAVVAHVEAAVALGAREVERAHRQVVDVDLQPERHDAAVGQLHDLAGPADRAALLEAALDAAARGRSARSRGSRPWSCSGRSRARSSPASEARARTRGAARLRGCDGVRRVGSRGPRGPPTSHLRTLSAPRRRGEGGAAQACCQAASASGSTPR